MKRLARHRVAMVVLALACVPLDAAAQWSSDALGSFRGSVPTGTTSAATLQLTLREAIERGLSANLGAIEQQQGVRTARGEWLARLSTLLPNVNASVSSTTEQIALASLGFTNVPGLALPAVLGPFSFVDARVSVSQQVFNWSDLKSAKAASAARQASEQTYKAARELVVQATANAYLVTIADLAMVDATRAQVETATALHQQASDQNAAGLVAAIDVLRARVQLQTEQQRLIAAENQLAIDKLALARVIGLPPGQPFALADDAPYTELGEWGLDEALRRAYLTRPDYQSAETRVRAAGLDRQAATARNYPSVAVDVNYGAIGTTFASSNGTVEFTGSLVVPIFQGTSVRADVLRADAALQRARAERDDLGGRIDEQVRTAFLNLTSANQLVTVARSNAELAKQTLTQAQHRMAAGVADNLEVVQAQESVATAAQSLIGSLYAYNAAKVALAHAVGEAEQSTLATLGVK